MSFTASVFRVMIASPGDVKGERGIVRELVHEWNSAHAAKRNLILLPLGWETDVAPEMGDDPQSIVNRRILKDADLLIAIFWTRIGTPTADYDSGTVEEIEKHLAEGKPAMIYFSSQPVVPDSVDPDQYAKLKAFKASCKSRGLLEEYLDLTDFRNKVSRHLQLTLNSERFQGLAETGLDLISELGRMRTGPGQALSQEAKILLKAGSLDSRGGIWRVVYAGGTMIQSDTRTFTEGDDPRSIATWEAALEELESAGFIRASSGKREYFDVTRAGFDFAETLEA